MIQETSSERYKIQVYKKSVLSRVPLLKKIAPRGKVIQSTKENYPLDYAEDIVEAAKELRSDWPEKVDIDMVLADSETKTLRSRIAERLAPALKIVNPR